MKSRVTITHLARRLNVHPSTISLGLRGSHHVSGPLQNRIHALAQRLGYAPNHMARSLRHSSTKTLGVIFPYATAPYYATLLDAFYAETMKRGFHLEVCFHQWNPQEESVMVRKLLQRQVEGLILLPADETSFDLLAEHLPANSDFPVSSFGSFNPKLLPSCVRGCVATDLHAGSMELGEHLLEMGHRNVALLVPSLRPSQMNRLGTNLEARETGLRAVFGGRVDARLRVLYADDVTISPMDWRWGSVDTEFRITQLMTERLLSLSPRPTAIVTSNEPSAHALLNYLYTQGCRVPENISVACYDGTFLSEYGVVSLTCVKQPIPEMVRQLVDLVLSPPSNQRRRKPEMRLLPPVLVKRQSVARIETPEVK